MKKVVAFGEKLGMTALTDKSDGGRVAVSAVLFQDMIVLGKKELGVHGYDAVIIAHSGIVDSKKISKPLRGIYSKAQIEPRRSISEVRDVDYSYYSVGNELSVSMFDVGDYADVQGFSVGKGFAGGMKRHNFSGLESSHGVSISHRSLGSTGQRQDPGRVFKNKKMPGRLGGKKVTEQGLEIYLVDEITNVIFIKGSIPGKSGSYVRVTVYV